MTNTATNAYQKRQLDLKARLLDRADQALQQAQQLNNQVEEDFRLYPAGQPILVGHHSEGPHRRFLARLDNLDRRACEQVRLADRLQEKAAAVGTGGISSQDPTAIEQLQAELAKLEAYVASIKAANLAMKKMESPDEAKQYLDAQGIEYFRLERRPAGGYKLPAYCTTNAGANIRRIRQRIEELTALAETEDYTLEAGTYTVWCDREEGRVGVDFNGKPSEEVRNLLKRNAFCWAPSRGSWVRPFTANAWQAGKHVHQELEKLLV